MQGLELYDNKGHKIKAEVLFTHYDLDFQKKYIIYTIDDDIVASSYDVVDNQLVINNDLTTKEYDMLDNILNKRLCDNYA